MIKIATIVVGVTTIVFFATIVVGVSTIVVDQDCDNCDWCYDNCGWCCDNCAWLRQFWKLQQLSSHQAYIPVINWYLLCYWFVVYLHGGWWFKGCGNACLTCGPWRTSADASSGGMMYIPFADDKALKAAEMKLKHPWTNSFSLFIWHSFHWSSFHWNLFCSLQKLLTAIQINCWQKAIQASSPDLMINIDQAYVSEHLHIFSG